jgi:predicted lipoprotein with Yx(FWY)xxD motif
MRLISVLAIGVVGAAIIGGGIYAISQRQAAPSAVVAEAPLSTPPGVTFQTVRTGGTVLLAMAGINIPATGTAYADAKGMTLYTSDNDEPGKSACAGDCAKAWPALPSPADAKPFGDWSVVTRDDGSKQWALRDKPLYTSVRDTKLMDGSGNGVDGVWHIAVFKPAEGHKLPDGVAIQELSNAAGIALVNDQGMPLYVFDGDAAGRKPSCVTQPCTDHWSAYQAAQLAKPVGDFTVVDRGDGIFQWGFQGRPLYSFDGDVDPGDATGNGVDGKWHVAMLRRNFMPPDVKIARNHFGGDNFVTQAGMTLYVRDRVVGTNTGHNMRAGSRGNPIVGHILGAATCDADCAKIWVPLAAPPDAQPSGYWEVLSRPDGGKQWTYRGYAVYSYAKDEKPGDMRGVDETQIMGDTDPFIVADLGVKGMGALYWHAVAP